MEDEELRVKYFLDLDWFKKNNRSFPALVQARLCPSCQRKRSKRKNSADRDNDSLALLENIRACCSQSPDYFPASLPLKEAMFRVFLASREPLDIEELHQQLETQLGAAGDRRDISVKTLERLLQKDTYYGLCQFIPPLIEGQ